MAHPSDYSPNQAWIFFKLSHVPVSTELDGEFDVFALMDAASLYILGSELVPAGSLAAANLPIRSLLNIAHSQATVWPEKLLISETTSVANLVSEAGAHGVSVEAVSEAELSKFTKEAREGFKAHFGGGELH